MQILRLNATAQLFLLSDMTFFYVIFKFSNEPRYKKLHKILWSEWCQSTLKGCRAFLCGFYELSKFDKRASILDFEPSSYKL